jgi:FkbM family methyltransferase
VVPVQELEFLLSLRGSGVYEGIPYVRLANGDMLLGDTPPERSPYLSVYESHRDLFEQLGVEQGAVGAMFDALISYHLENCDSPVLRKSAFIPRGGTVIDVGTRGGQFLVKAARFAETVVGVDATRFADRFANLHIRANELANVTFVQAVVSDKSGEVAEFYAGSAAESYSGLFEETFDGVGAAVITQDVHTERLTVTTETVDALVERLELNRCDLVIFQINGGETLAVRGMTETVSRFKPVILATAYQRRAGAPDPANDLADFLAPYGYEPLYRVGTETVLAPIP